MLHFRIGCVALFVIACSGGSNSPMNEDVDAAISGDDAAQQNGDDSSTPKSDAAGDANMQGDANPPKGLATLGSLVVLGDSMSDGGGQGPFYYNLLKNDLTTKYGAIQYVNNAQSGSKTGSLSGQVDGLPKSLKGPVAVCITSGGNDMKAALPLIVLNQDAAARAQMGANIQSALGKLLAPNRFGQGVQVYVFEANIYDASDGKGDYGSHNCAFGNGLPAIPSDPYFANWNGVIATEVNAKGQTVTDIHKHFLDLIRFRRHSRSFPMLLS